MEDSIIIREFLDKKTTIEDIARAIASMDGKRDQFDACKADNDREEHEGFYEGYMQDARELLARASTYAWHRNVKGEQKTVDA